MTGNRMSSLPVTEYCGGYHKVLNPSGRAAVLSTAFHARCAKAEDAEAKWHRLTPEEQAQVEEWHAPTVAKLGDGTRLHYVDARTEMEVALTADGLAVNADDPKAISIGHIDMAWDYQGVAYVGDIKKSEFTAEVDSLQLAAYAFAYANAMNCGSICCGIWAATEGEWTWGPIIDLDSEEALTLWLRVKHAILNVSDEYSVGPHCRKCYARWHCPAWMMPGWELERFSSEGPKGDQLAILLECQRAEDTIKRAKENLQQFAREHGIRDGKGKVYLPVATRGRETLDKDALAKVVNLKDFTKRGSDYDVFRWVKEK